MARERSSRNASWPRSACAPSSSAIHSSVAADGEREPAVAGAEQDPEQRQQRVAGGGLQDEKTASASSGSKASAKLPAAVADHPVDAEPGGGDQAEHALEAGPVEGHGRRR